MELVFKGDPHPVVLVHDLCTRFSFAKRETDPADPLPMTERVLNEIVKYFLNKAISKHFH